MIAKFKNFIVEVQKEMKKVSWPTREQLKESTIVVLTITFILTVFIYLVDFSLDKVIGLIF